jgi:CRP-like cAMP-binding protein
MDLHDTRLAEFLSAVPRTDRDDADRFSSVFRKKRIEKGRLFLGAGDIQSQIGFVHRGLFRYYYLDDCGNETTKYFCTENDVLFNIVSYSEGTPSLFTIEALEDSEISCASVVDFRTMVENHVGCMKLYLHFLERSYVIKEHREADFLLKNASDRYRDFIRSRKGLEQRVSQRHIASYLGIAPESLSRIRRQFLNKANRRPNRRQANNVFVLQHSETFL